MLSTTFPQGVAPSMAGKHAFQKRGRESPPGTLQALDPRQREFFGHYMDANSPTFGNCYQSALRAGYTDQTARNLMHLRPAWLSEIIGQNTKFEPEDLLAKLGEIINDRGETTQNKLRAIDMMMEHHRMYGDRNVFAMQFNIQSVLDN